MKTNQFSGLIILFFFTIACADKNSGDTANANIAKDSPVAVNVIPSDTLTTGKVITRVFCKANAAQSYALYLPAKANNMTLPVIYFFDPHGDGAFPLSKYKALADTYNFILAGSNNSKNGNDWPTTENAWRALFEDTQKRLKINVNRVYTCGFSGGAKVAGYIGLNHNEVKGVIANGAGLPDETTAGNFHFSFTAIAGDGDMNMTELVTVNAGLDRTQTRHRIIFFNGKHEWAPQNTMDIAFTGLQFDAMRDKSLPVNGEFIEAYINNSKKRIALYSGANDLIKAETECMLSISLLEGLAGAVNWFKEKDFSIKNSTAYQEQWQSRQNLLVAEQNMKSVYMQQFQQGDRNYWVKTISDVQAKGKAPAPEGGMYQRLLAYLSLAFYSISNQMIKGQQNKEAGYFVDLYKMADASNPEAWYFSAILKARNNNAKGAEDDLLKAVSNGFTDKSRMMQQAEFKNLGTRINFQEIDSKMKKSE